MNSGYKNKQQGAVLAVSLIILLVITILSIQGIQSTLMQEKMTAAVRDGHVSLEAAEAGLVDAEVFLETLVSTVDFEDDGTGGLYTNGNGPLPSEVFDETVWASAKTATTIDFGGGITITPQYFIEELGIITEAEDSLDPGSDYAGITAGGTITGFKVISRATGKDSNTSRIVVSYYGKRL